MRFFGLLSVVSLIFLAGCNIETPPENNHNITARGNDIVINEVFHVSPKQYYNYSWIELYNPTNKPVRWYTETIIDDTTKVRNRLVVRFRAQRQFYGIQASGSSISTNPSFITLTDSGYGYFTNYHTDQLIDPEQGLVLRDQYYSADGEVIFPGQFVVIISDKDKFDQHTLPGPFNPSVLDMTLAFKSIQGTSSPALVLPLRRPVVFPLDSADKKYYWLGANALWDLLDVGEVALLRIEDTLHLAQGEFADYFSTDSPGDTTYLDVVRYGNYRPSPDPFPGNTPAGTIPDGYSLARYGNYYKTGNTADEFYASPDPIPGWLNQRQKQ